MIIGFLKDLVKNPVVIVFAFFFLVIVSAYAAKSYFDERSSIIEFLIKNKHKSTFKSEEDEYIRKRLNEYTNKKLKGIYKSLSE